MRANISAYYPVATLAERTFLRRFAAATGVSPRHPPRAVRGSGPMPTPP